MRVLFEKWKGFLFFYWHGCAGVNIVGSSTDKLDIVFSNSKTKSNKKTTESTDKTMKKAHEVRVSQMQKQGLKAQQKVKTSLYNK
ncbi:MAG: hypothetical protein WCK37_05190 [Candidatus Falkowbacteria bacterium]